MLSLNTNAISLNIQRNLFSTSKTFETSLQRLSSGLKINNAGDDAAGLSLSTKLSSDIRCLSQSKMNVQSGINYLSIGSGSLQNMLNVTQRIRDLAIQSANGVYSSEERRSLQKEVDELSKELSQIRDSATFSDKKIFGEKIKFIKEVTQISSQEATDLGYITINSAEEFVNLISENGNDTAGKTFILTDNIDMSSINYVSRKNFQGTLDGNGYSIKNVSINSSSPQQGLFSTTSGAIIKNLGLENVNIKGNDDTGGLIGKSFYTRVDNCYVSGNVSGVSRVGGVIGSADNSPLISNTFSSCTVSGINRVGGIAGYGANCTIETSYTTGSISASLSISGGIIGTADYGINISNSYSSANVSATQSNAGGIAGSLNDSQVHNVFSEGNISSAQNVGGIIGNSYHGTITESYAKGKISGDLNCGGLAGSILYGNILNSFYNTDTTTQYDIIGANSGGTVTDSQGLNNSEMSNSTIFTNVGWDENIWDFSKGSPNLKAFENTSTPNNEPLCLQIGIKNNSSSVIEIDTSFSFSTTSFNISSAEAARNEIKTLDDAISLLTAKMSDFGANINRLESIVDLNDIKQQNLSSSNSTIKDTDIAIESSKLTKKQILKDISSNLLIQNQNIQKSMILKLLNII